MPPFTWANRDTPHRVDGKGGAVKLNCYVPGSYGNGIHALGGFPCIGTNTGDQGTYWSWLTGYPGTSSGLPGAPNYMYEDYGPIYNGGTCDELQHHLDGTGGQSGAPITTTICPGFSECAIGHHSGDADLWWFDYNWAKQWLPDTDFAPLVSWRGY